MASSARSLTFGGSLPIAITLVSSQTQQATTHYLQVPRNTYLAIVLHTQLKALLALAGEPQGAGKDAWFDTPSEAGVPLRWHWPIGLIADFHGPSSTSSAPAPPFPLSLHLDAPPAGAESSGNGLEAARMSYMNALKEGEYVRQGSVKRITNLRKEQQDALWEGLMSQDYETYNRTYSRLLPLPGSHSPDPSSGSGGGGGSISPSPTPSATPSSSSGLRAIPLRVFLPFGGPILRDSLNPSAVPSLGDALAKLCPLLFPPAGKGQKEARAVVQGVEMPLEAELEWLAAAMAGADGWISVVVRLRREGETIE